MSTDPRTRRDRDPAEVLAAELAGLEEAAVWVARGQHLRDQLRDWTGERTAVAWVKAPEPTRRTPP
jgi:hypothetical protein